MARVRWSCLFWWLCSAWVFADASLSTRPIQVGVPSWGVWANQEDDYFIKLLSLCLTKTESTYGAAIITPYPEKITGARFIANLKSNHGISVIWHGTNQQYERELLPIKISLVKELNDYRVLLIRNEDRDKFSAVKSVDDLRVFNGGGGADWPSTDIFRTKGLRIVTVSTASLLFDMLKAKRIDYITRNLFEVWSEAEKFDQQGLIIEPTLLIHASVPFYFFVNKENNLLATRLETGLRTVMSDGSFEQLFSSDAGFKRGQAELSSGNRRILELTN